MGRLQRNPAKRYGLAAGHRTLTEDEWIRRRSGSGKTRQLENLLDLTDAEREELWSDVMPRLVQALSAAFQPDRINYAHLTNRVRQVHWHVVPGYEKNPKRQFAGHTFVDKRVGKIFRTERFRLPDEVLDQIRDHLKQHLS